MPSSSKSKGRYLTIVTFLHLKLQHHLSYSNFSYGHRIASLIETFIQKKEWMVSINVPQAEDLKMPCNCKVFYNPFVCFLCEQHKDWVHSLNALDSETRAIVKRRVSYCLVLDIITHISLFIALLTNLILKTY